jgi:hypothetical protein
VDADDVRQFVVAGAQAPWRGDEGAAQYRLGARNTSMLAGSFLRAGFDVVMADVLDPSTVTAYRTGLPDCLIVHLVVPFDEARRRSRSRRVWLTDDEFALLHRRDNDDPPAVDVRIDVGSMSFEDQVDAVEQLWRDRRAQP